MPRTETEHGLFGKIIKFAIVALFTTIGVAMIVLGALSLKKIWFVENKKWVSIVNIVFGALLLLSPTLLNHKREGFGRFIKVLLAILFIIIGILYITGGSIVIAKHWYADNYKWYYIVSIVFGCLLFTSPVFLKKD